MAAALTPRPHFYDDTLKVDGSYIFNVECDLSIVNSLRRVMLSDIPNVGIRFDPYNEVDHDIKFDVNTGCLHNEIIGHRLSLIPICMHPNDIGKFDKSASPRLVIDAQNTGNGMVDVTTDDIKVLDVDGKEVRDHAYFPKFVPHEGGKAYPILITKLKPNLSSKENGDKLRLEATLSLGTASQNAAWSPVSKASFFNAVDDKAADEAFEKKCEGIAALTAEQKKELRIRFDTLEKFQHFKRNKYGEPSHMIFTVKSECAMTPQYIVFKSLSILCGKVDKLYKSVNEGDAAHVVIRATTEAMYDITLKNETHTLGNLLQAQLYNTYVRDQGKSVLKYIGYICPHPLEKTIVVKVAFASAESEPAQSMEAMTKWLVGAVDGVRSTLAALTKEWVEFAKLTEQGYDDVAAFMEAERRE